MNTRQTWQRFDLLLFAVVLLLCIFGVALISTAIAGNPTLEDHPQRQAIFLGIGLVVLFLVASFDYHIWTTLSKPFYALVALLLLVVFVIGGAFGLAPQVRERANHSLSLSKMTMPHELCHVLLLEQIYRACTINRGIDYHH